MTPGDMIFIILASVALACLVALAVQFYNDY